MTLRKSTMLAAVIMLAVLAAMPALSSELGPVTVQVDGVAAMPDGAELPNVMREAVLDARRNALLQAHTLVRADTLVENHRVTEKLVRSWSAGRVHALQVLDSGPIEVDGQRFYRVTARAIVEPLEALQQADAPDGVRNGGGRPAVALTVLPESASESDLQQLADSISACGVDVVAGGGVAVALQSHVQIASVGGGDARWIRLEWSVSTGEGGPEGVGRLLLAADGEGGDRVLSRAGVFIAQDACRLWFAPRALKVRAEGIDRRTAAALEEAVIRAGGGPAVASDSALEVVLTVSGHPAPAVAGLLAQAGAADRLTIRRMGFSDVVLGPAAQQSGGAGAGPE